VLPEISAAAIAAHFSLGSDAVLSGPAARGEQGQVWRITTPLGAWAGKELFQRRLAEAFAPGRADGQLLVKRLPAHADLRYEHIGVIVGEVFKTGGAGKFQRMQARNCILRTENGDGGFGVERVRFSSPADSVDGRIADDIALHV